MRDIAIDLFKAIDTILRQPQNNYPKGARDEEIVAQKDIVYNESLPEVCLLDLYLPPAALPEGDCGNLPCEVGKPVRKKSPVILYIHGGGFVAGGKEYREGISRWYASHGVTVVNVNYGLCPDYKYPEPLRHLVSALDFVGANANKLGIDKKKVIVSGDSAGAYYACMLAAASSSRRFCELLNSCPKTKVAAAILNCGLYDIEKTINTKFLFNVDEQIFERFTGLSEKNFDSFEYRELCSPVNFITPNFPPTFVQYAQKDLFCGGQGERLVEKLEEQGVPHRKVFSRGLLSNHCYPLNWRDSNAKKANEALLKFLDDFLNDALDPVNTVETVNLIKKNRTQNVKQKKE